MKDLLAVISPVFEPRLDWSIDYGLHLARLVGAHFTALISDIDTESSRRQVVPNGLRHDAKLVESTAAASDVGETAALIRAAAARFDVSCCVQNYDNTSRSLRETLIETAQLRDLVLLDVCEPLNYPRKGLVEAVLFNTGRPIVLVPANVRCSGVRTAIIAWDGTPSSVRALHDSLPLLAHVEDVVLVTVSGDKQLRWISREVDFCRYLARWNIVARAETIERDQRTVGTALLEYAQEIDAGFLIMGGYGHAKEREFIFGSATRDIFQSIPDIPVLLSH
jgi:nucleotide-binding universal stress UspA family protein